MISYSQIATIHPPIRGAKATINPAMISAAPAIIMILCAGIGSMRLANGARYISQFTSLSVNWSTPAMMGTIVKVIRKTQKARRTELLIGSILKVVAIP